MRWGHDEFVQLVLADRARNQGNMRGSRRDPCAVVRYLVIKEISSLAQKGEESCWLDEKQFADLLTKSTEVSC